MGFITSYHTLILWALAALEVVLVVFILLTYEKSKAILALCGLLVGLALLSFLVGLQLTPISPLARLTVAKLAFYSGGVSFAFLLALAASYPIPTFISTRILVLSVVLPLAIFLPYILASPNFVERVTVHGNNLEVSVGRDFLPFIIFSITYFVIAFAILVDKIRKLGGEQRRQVGLLALTLGVSGVFGIIANHIFPLIGVESNRVYGPEGTGLIALVVAAIVLRK